MNDREIAEEIYDTQMSVMENRIEEHGKVKGIYIYAKEYYAELMGLD